MPTRNESIISKLLGNAPALIGVSSAIALVGSVIYDWGYLTYLGLTFSEIQTTLSDHLRSTILWAPWSGVIIFGAGILESCTRYLEERYERKTTGTSRRFEKVVRKAPLYLSLLLILGAPVAKIFGRDIPLGVWQLSAIVLWLTISYSGFVQQKLLSSTSSLFKTLFKLVPAAIIFLGFYGARQAKADTDENSKKYRIYLTSNTENYLEAVPLRNFENVILIWKHSAKILELIPQKNINRIEILNLKK